ncbi:MAG: hypothetical protein ACLFV5_10055 [Anaerolineales bacterium]
MSVLVKGGMMDLQPEEEAAEEREVPVETYVERDELQKITAWAGMGTPRQFFLEVTSKLSGTEYEAEFEDDVLTCYRVEKQGGILGIGGKTVREPVLQMTFPEEAEVGVAEEPRDQEFIEFLAGELQQH